MIQAVFVRFVLFTATIAAVRRAASLYFVIDAMGFASANDHHHHHAAYAMSPEVNQQQPTAQAQPAAQPRCCTQCGVPSSKKCAACKLMRYWFLAHKKAG